MPQGSQFAPQTGGSRGLGRHRQLPKATVGQVRRPGRQRRSVGLRLHTPSVTGTCSAGRNPQGRGTSRQGPTCLPFQDTLWSSKGNLRPPSASAGGGDRAAQRTHPTLVSRVPGSPLPESPTTCEMWVGLGTGWCWGPLQVEGSCTPGS